MSATDDRRPAASVLAFAQIGDLHLTDERQRNDPDFPTIGAWLKNGIFGTQLGPNRNGRHW